MYEAPTDRQPVSAGYYRPTHDHRSRSFLFSAIGGVGRGFLRTVLGGGQGFSGPIWEVLVIRACFLKAESL